MKKLKSYLITVLSTITVTTIIVAPVTWHFCKKKYFQMPDVVKETIYIKQKSGDEIRASNWFFTENIGGCDLMADGKGEAELKFKRPDIWRTKTYHHRFIANAVLSFGSDDIKYGGEALYYYMLLQRLGIGGGIEVTANQKLKWDAEIKAGIIADIK